MKRLMIVAVAVAVCPWLATVASGHDLDHPMPTFAPQGPLSTGVNAGGPNADWELVSTIPTGNPHSDIDFFTHGGETYASVGTLAGGPNAAGQTIIRLTQGGEVRPAYVTGHPSASCVTTTGSITGLQHDVEATPKGGQILNTPNPNAAGGEAQLLVDATDANGRCHDSGILGQQAPRGGLELIDVTDPTKPKEIGLTSHVGEAHTVNVDPKRPHIAIVSSSDSTQANAEGKRVNEISPTPPSGPNFSMDGIEVVDMSSCMNFPAATTLEQKRDACRPQVFRYRWPDLAMMNSHSFPRSVGSCHETEIYPDDTLVCAGLFATAHFDLRGAFDDRGTPNDFTDDKPRGTPLPCRVRDSSTAAPIFRTGAKVTDCVNGEGGQSLTVAEWLKIGSPSLEGVNWKGTVHHMGFEDQRRDNVAPPFDSTQDIFVSHEAELTGSRKFTIVTDERGGGVLPGGATCSPGADNRIGNGGLHAFPTSSFKPEGPTEPRQAQEANYAKTSDGRRAIHRVPVRTGPQASVCTSHVMQQIPGQNRIFMAWYSQATQVIDFIENPDGTFDWKEVGWFIPEGANQWVSAIFKAQENTDGSFTYWGATGDFALSGTGRNAIDIYKVTLPPPAQSYGPTGFGRVPLSGACARAAGFEAVNARKRGDDGLRLRFTPRSSRKVRVRLFRKSRGPKRGPRTVIKTNLVKDFGYRAKSFTWKGRPGLRRGYYFAEFLTKAPNGRADRRRVGLRKEADGFRKLRPFERWSPCGLVENARLTSPVFGGSTKAPLALKFRLERTSSVAIAVRRKGKLVRRFAPRTYEGDRTHRRVLDLPRGSRRGEYVVALKATRPGRTSTVRLVGRKLF